LFRRESFHLAALNLHDTIIRCVPLLPTGQRGKPLQNNACPYVLKAVRGPAATVGAELDSPPEEAVLSELVSEAKFPGNWEKYRDFYRRDL
jgi:hypothetical protein